MRETLKRVFSWMLLISALTLQSQKLRFKQITGEEGLSTNFVRAVLQDDKGFMWFGTQDGLNRYDGYGIRVFRALPGETAALPGSDITCLLQVRPHLLLIGTREGLCYFDLITERFSPIKATGFVKNTRVNALMNLDSGSVLAGTDGGLALLDLRSDSIVQLLFDGRSLPVKSLGAYDRAAFVGTGNEGLWKVGGKNQVLKAEVTIPEFMDIPEKGVLSHITVIRQYGDMMYLGTASGGIFKVDRALEVQAHIGFRKLNDNSNSIRDFIVRNNHIYAATAYGAVVYHLISGQTSFYTRQETAQSLNSNPCNCIFADKQNNIWIGTDLGGVNVSMYRSLRFPLSPYNYETAFENVYSFAEVKKNTLVVGGVKSLHEINNETGQETDHSAVLGNGTARCIYREDENTWWIGTWGNGLLRYDRAKKKSTVLPGVLGEGTILTLFREGDYLFAGSAGSGLFRLNLTTMEVTVFNEKNGLPSLSINCIYKDSKQKMWLGTYDGGLVLLKDVGEGESIKVEKVFTTKGKPGEIASNVIFGINEANNGALWVATSAGVSKLLPDGTFKTFGQKDGLPNTYLYALQKDSAGHFWLSSNAGLIRFNPGLTHEQITFKSYGLKDGLVNTGYNMGAALSSTTGLMYFGGSKGFNAFRPTTIKDNFHAPPVFITGCRVGGKELVTDSTMTFKHSLELDWSENSLQFELTALDFTDPQKNLFSYMLEGYDEGWSEPSHVRHATYTGLPGGTYLFKVKAANNDGVWNEKPALLSVRVVPPFWRTMPFYVFIAVMGLGAIYGFTVVRTRAIRRENVMLENKVAERTRELEARNKDITSSIEYARRIQEAILPSKDHIFSKLKKVFILYRPKDIVSGDFYWFSERDGIKIFAVVDCTGHGVPGAFMSMIGHNLLDQVVTENGITDPGEILNQLHRGVTHALRQGHNEVSTNDGMDVSIIAISDSTREVKWAGANRPLIMIDANGEMTRFNGDKDPVGGAQAHLDRAFTTVSVKVEVATMAYLFSDGYADQFGGERGKKFMVKRFHELLTNIHRLGAEEQRVALEEHFEKWKQNHEQVDDVLIVGIEI